MNTASELAALRATVEQFMSRDEEDRHEAKTSRDEMSEAVDEIREDMRDVHRRLDKVEPVTDMVSKWKLVGTGVLLTIGAIAGAVGAAASFLREKIMQAFSG